MHAASIMTVPAVSIGLDTSLDRIQELMDQHGFRHLPVVEDGQVVGIVSDRDVLGATGWLAARVHACRGPVAADAVPSKAREILHAPVLDVRDDEGVDRICSLMVERGIGCVPVTRGGRLVGIVTEVDVLRALVVDGECHRLGEGDDPTVGAVMSPRPFRIDCHATLGDAEKLCHEKGVRHLVVDVPGDGPGIVSDRDLRRAAGRGRPHDAELAEEMTAPAITTRRDAPLSEAAALLLEHHISALPVVGDDRETVLGILSVSDILSHCVEVYRVHADPGTSS